ncbi:MAG: tetratricopeptide repeat protein [Myxococcota bacterium]
MHARSLSTELRRWLPFLAPALAAVAFGAGALGHGFVYDDHWTIEHNRWLHMPLDRLLQGLVGAEWRAPGVLDASRPAMVVSTWIDRRLFGSDPFGYRLHSLLLHGACSVAVAAFAFAVGRRRQVALWAGLFFAVAPVHAEVAAAINYREDLLATLGTFTALTVVLWPAARPHRSTCVLVATVAWALALLGKESALALLVLLPVLGVACGGASFWRRRERTWFALASVLILWGGWRWALALRGDGVARAMDQGVSGRVLATARYELWALGQSLWPVNVAPIHPDPGPAGWGWLLALGGVALGTVALMRWRPSRVVGVGLAVALLAPVVSSPLVGPANEWADRYLYGAVAGSSLIFAAGMHALARRVDRRVVALLGVLIVGALGVRRVQAMAPWSDDTTLFTFAVERAPRSPRAWAALAHAHREAGRANEALQAAGRALALDPHHAGARLTRALVFLSHGDVGAARDEVDHAHRRRPDHPGVRRVRRCLRRDDAEALPCIRGERGPVTPAAPAAPREDGE